MRLWAITSPMERRCRTYKVTLDLLRKLKNNDGVQRLPLALDSCNTFSSSPSVCSQGILLNIMRFMHSSTSSSRCRPKWTGTGCFALLFGIIIWFNNPGYFLPSSSQRAPNISCCISNTSHQHHTNTQFQFSSSPQQKHHAATPTVI